MYSVVKQSLTKYKKYIEKEEVTEAGNFSMNDDISGGELCPVNSLKRWLNFTGTMGI